MLRIRRDDLVYVLKGKDKGKKGKVLMVEPALGRALVENINLCKRTRRPTQDNPKGGIVAKEALIALSSLMLVCKQCNKPSRFTTVTLKDGSRSRKCKECDGVM
ncbi:MAG: 50S ribosomal protein L24 [Candidatus Omnitrophota bacterium]